MSAAVADARVQLAVLGANEAFVIHAAMVKDFFSVCSIGDRINPTFFQSRTERGIADTERAAQNRGDDSGRKSAAACRRQQRAAHDIGSGLIQILQARLKIV